MNYDNIITRSATILSSSIVIYLIGAQLNLGEFYHFVFFMVFAGPIIHYLLFTPLQSSSRSEA